MKSENWSGHEPRQVAGSHPGRRGTSTRVVERLDGEAALRLLSGASYGRVVFVNDGEPEIRPMSHLVDAGEVIVRTRLSAGLSAAIGHGGGLRITYEADELDVEGRVGWSVIVSGVAAPIADPQRHAYYKQHLRTMLARPDDTIIAIDPETVSGIRIVPGADGTAPGTSE